MYTLNCKGKLLAISRPLVMGIINATPDSFYDNSRQQAAEAALIQAEAMLQQGAAILDVGGQSTRPGAVVAGPEAEAARVVPVIKAICSRFPQAIVSVDTFFASVAKAAVNEGAAIVNDVSAGLYDAAMLQTVATLKVPYICMHHKGVPVVPGSIYHYNNLIAEVIDFFSERISACRNAGINDLVIDPGFGFGKNVAQNMQLLREMEALKLFGLPVLAGLSRKSTICKILGVEAGEALNGTTVLNTLALQNGAALLRVHDVVEAIETIKLVEAYRAKNN